MVTARRICSGGHDPYSASKAVAEIDHRLLSRFVFCQSSGPPGQCRAGNVIGGGDWARDRIVPDCMTALQKKEPIPVRNPPRHSPVAACAGTVERLFVAGGEPGRAEIAPYRFVRVDFRRLILAQTANPIARWRNWCGRFCKIGPAIGRTRPIPTRRTKRGCCNCPPTRPISLLRSRPVWNFSESIAKTVSWYRNAERLRTSKEFKAQTQEQIVQYMTRARFAPDSVGRGRKVKMRSPEQLKAEILRLTREYSSLMHQKQPARRRTESATQVRSRPDQSCPTPGAFLNTDEVAAAISSTLDFWLTLGKEGEAFEQGLAKFLGVKNSVSCNSGSSANLLAVAALTSPKLGNRRLKPGDEIITVAAGFPTTVAPILQNGFVPVFIDNDPSTLNGKVEQLEEAYTPGKTRAVMMAHTLGNPFKLADVTEFCQKHELWLIEDNCDALGCTYDGKSPGRWAISPPNPFIRRIT